MKQRRPPSTCHSSSPESHTPSVVPEGHDIDVGTMGNAAMASFILNGPGEDPMQRHRDDAAEAEAHAPDWGPTGVRLGRVGRLDPSVGRSYQMEVTPNQVDTFMGLHVREEFSNKRVLGVSDDDLTQDGSASALLNGVTLGEEGVFEIDAMGSFVDHHHGGGLGLEVFNMLTPEARQRGLMVLFDQHYTWNGQRLGGFTVSREMAFAGSLVDSFYFRGVDKTPL